MPTHASTAKRMRSDKKRRVRSRMVKSMVRSAQKKARQAPNKDQAQANLTKATSLLDKAVSKGVIHRRTASRQKSRLARLVNAMEAKPAKDSPGKKK